MITKDAMKARYVELGAMRAKINAKLDPLRAEMDKLVAVHQPKERALSEKIRKAREGLYELDQEAALIARALGNETPTVG